VDVAKGGEEEIRRTSGGVDPASLASFDDAVDSGVGGAEREELYFSCKYVT
jgi:hypothetical protein